MIHHQICNGNNFAQDEPREWDFNTSTWLPGTIVSGILTSEIEYDVAGALVPFISRCQ